MSFANPDEYRAYMREYMKERYRQTAEKVRAYKVQHGCMDCGYNEHHAALEFDHREGMKDGDKRVARIVPQGWKRVALEIEKCDVVCGNCHRIRTFDRLQMQRANLES